MKTVDEKLTDYERMCAEIERKHAVWWLRKQAEESEELAYAMNEVYALRLRLREVQAWQRRAANVLEEVLYEDAIGDLLMDATARELMKEFKEGR